MRASGGIEVETESANGNELSAWNANLMDSDLALRFVYLLLLLGALVGSYYFLTRRRIRVAVQQAASWAFIFIGVIVAYGLWSDVKDAVAIPKMEVSEESITLARAPDRHFYVVMDVNGESIRFLIDTGATNLVLTKSDARAVGIDLEDLDFYGRATTANGEVRTAPVRLDRVEFGPWTHRNVQASVNEGELDTSLLGQSFLSRFEKIEISGGQMTFRM